MSRFVWERVGRTLERIQFKVNAKQLENKSLSALFYWKEEINYGITE